MLVHLTIFPDSRDSIVRQKLKTYIGLGTFVYLNYSKNTILLLLSKYDLDNVNIFIISRKFLLKESINEFIPNYMWLLSDVG